MPTVEILEQKGYHFLWIDDELWMWDVPGEIDDQKSIAKEAWGDILVAGYGLGLVQKYLFENPRVRSVLTIEKYQEVLDCAKETYGTLYGNILVGDFNTYTSRKRYDCVIGDTWKDQSFREIGDYLDFKRQGTTLLKKGGSLLGWGADYFEFIAHSTSIES
ncbi:MAG: hypothetical protein WCO52_04000 [bacterium]